ncbi:MAG: ABC transporter ATP-binding protein [Thaumarchaeota archaeon]|nr:ABC transporter ATP-binding protein [Nitrososphaerota archaeon]
MTKLQVIDITKRFGNLVALRECALEISSEGVFGLIGPNGSGKTTLFNIITGFSRPNSGKIVFDGKNIAGRNPVTISRSGLVRTFQLSRIFPNLSVWENLEVSRPKHVPESRIEEMLDLVNLKEQKRIRGGRLSYGQKKQLDIARALMLDPSVLLLDEPTAGLEPSMVRSMMEQIKYIHDLKKGVFIIEHNMNVIMNIAEEIFVLHNGTKIAEGKPSEIQRNSMVIDAYLGTG